MKYLLVIFLFFTSIAVSAQEITLNHDDLGDKVLEYMNQHRKSLKLGTLQKDAILEKAAQDQSDYMLGIKKLSHEQSTSDKKSPKNRIKFYGGNDFDTYGENVLYLSIEIKNYAKNDIAILAKRIYQDWKESPPHYKNIIDKEYKYASIAFAFDSKTKHLFATTVFGNKNVN